MLWCVEHDQKQIQILLTREACEYAHHWTAKLHGSDYLEVWGQAVRWKGRLLGWWLLDRGLIHPHIHKGCL
ncbi:hypothetical protein HanIR_Chr03g0149761 [Helianthus annuus]|nr:hypothetical protein HanIR_Chr03g0149761 [Helianthus annuus]